MEKLESLPADLQAISYFPYAFGSWDAVLKVSGKRYRFLHEGKDNTLSLELSSSEDLPDLYWSRVWGIQLGSDWQELAFRALKAQQNLE